MATHNAVKILPEIEDTHEELPEATTILRLDLADREVCCGFGGTFAAKYGELSNAIVAQKSANIAASGADTLLAGDLGCLMNMAGKMQREGRTVRVRHVAEVLAGMTQLPPIGESAGEAKP